MAGRPKKSGLESKTARLKLASRNAPYWVAIGEGQQVGYRKGIKDGYWVARLTDMQSRKKVQESLGTADDQQDADGKEVLTYFQAVEAARDWFKRSKEAAEAKVAVRPSKNSIIVSQAMEIYIDYLKTDGKSGKSSEQAAFTYIYRDPIALKRLVDLTVDDIKAFRDGIADSPRRSRLKPKPVPKRARKVSAKSVRKPKGKWALAAESMDPETLKEELKRQRKSTANRVLTILRGALNYQVEQDPTIDDRAWRAVKSFKKADGVRTSYLEVEEQRKLLEACPAGLRELVAGALYTGARYGELRMLRVHHLYLKAMNIKIEDSKTYQPREIPLTEEGCRFFTRLVEGRKRNDFVFLRPDGMQWGKSHTFRPFRAACDAAGIEAIPFHSLRHSYASLLVMAGAELMAVAKILGHADTRMVEKHYGHLRKTWLHEQVNKFLPPIFPLEGAKSQAPVGTTSPVTVPLGVAGKKKGTKVYDATGGSTTTWTVERAVGDDDQA
jgi:integrase